MTTKCALAGLLLLLAVSLPAWSEVCLPLPDQAVYGAAYRTERESGRHAVKAETWRYWRRENRVAYEYPERGISEVWLRNKKGQLSFQRWFMHEERIIVYEFGDLRSVGKETQWQRVEQPFNLDELEQLKTAGQLKYHCLPAARYRGKRRDGDHVEVVRLQANGAIAAIAIDSINGSVKTRLTELKPAGEVAVFFASASDYRSTDFADVGDEEADPFISRLIAFGFVEHREQEGSIRYPEHKH